MDSFVAAQRAIAEVKSLPWSSLRTAGAQYCLEHPHGVRLDGRLSSKLLSVRSDHVPIHDATHFANHGQNTRVMPRTIAPAVAMLSTIDVLDLVSPFIPALKNFFSVMSVMSSSSVALKKPMGV